MCYIIVERYSVCRCLYYKHSVDMCAAHGTQNHNIEEKEVLVGYACEDHSQQEQEHNAQQGHYSDSGYGTASPTSTTQSRYIGR